MSQPEATQILAHFYRAAVMRADIWRQRLDATTNWAVVATIAVIAFTFGEAATPHFVLLMVIAFDMLFLLMEARRYQVYHLWELRIRALHHYLIAPALDPEKGADADAARRALRALGSDLGSTVPRISLFDAVAYRIRQNYGPLVTIVLLAWLLRLWMFPELADGWHDLIERAAVGLLPGAYVVTLVLLFFLTLVVAALVAPSEQIVDWAELRPPLFRMVPRRAPSPRSGTRAEPAPGEGETGAGGGTDA